MRDAGRHMKAHKRRKQTHEGPMYVRPWHCKSQSAVWKARESIALTAAPSKRPACCLLATCRRTCWQWGPSLISNGAPPRRAVQDNAFVMQVSILVW